MPVQLATASLRRLQLPASAFTSCSKHASSTWGQLERFRVCKWGMQPTLAQVREPTLFTPRRFTLRSSGRACNALHKSAWEGVCVYVCVCVFVCCK
jgi:hypothetical protein